MFLKKSVKFFHIFGIQKTHVLIYLGVFLHSANFSSDKYPDLWLFRNNSNDFKFLKLSLILKRVHISSVILTSYCTENYSLQNHLHPHHLQLTRTSVYFHLIVEKLQFSILIKEMKLLSKPFQI